MSINNSVSAVTYSYPPNTKAAAKMTERIAQENYDMQVYKKNNKPSYTWPVIGTIASTIALFLVKAMK